MRNVKLLFAILICSCPSFAQQNVEDEIKNLEQMEVKAVLAKDTTTLKKLWDENYIVHNPENKIVPAVANSTNRPVLNRPRSSFTREVERITVNGDVALSMGSETVGTAENSSSQKIINRRYTNVWMKKEGIWKLIARHANIICN
jgi:ketosteroid isomerase-like protein